MSRNQPADVQQREAAPARIRDGAVPFTPAPSVEKVDGPAADAREVLDRLLERPVKLLFVTRVDRRPDIGGGQSVEVGVAQQPVHLGAGIEQMEDQPSKGWKRGTVAVSKLIFLEPEDEVADAFGHRAHEKHGIRR